MHQVRHPHRCQPKRRDLQEMHPNSSPKMRFVRPSHLHSMSRGNHHHQNQPRLQGHLERHLDLGSIPQSVHQKHQHSRSQDNHRHLYPMKQPSLAGTHRYRRAHRHCQYRYRADLSLHQSQLSQKTHPYQNQCSMGRARVQSLRYRRDRHHHRRCLGHPRCHRHLCPQNA